MRLDRSCVLALPATRLAAIVLVIPLAVIASGCPSSGDGGAAAAEGAAAKVADAGPAAATLTGVSPRTTSNQFATPLLLFGRGFASGQKLRLGAPFGTEIPLHVDDDGHASAVLPAGLALPAETTEVQAALTLVDAQGAALGDPMHLVIVNDSGFVDVQGLVATGDLSWAVSASAPTDELFFVETATGKVDRVPAGDGPQALAKAVIDGVEHVVVAHRFSPELRILPLRPGPDGKRPARTLPGPTHAWALVVHDGVAYVGEHARDTLVAIELGKGEVRWTAPVVPNPRGIAVAGDHIAVGSMVAGEVELVARKDGKVSPAIAPRPGVRILGGHTEPFSDDIIGGRGVRALAFGDGMVFVASNGPNVGPNEQQMGVTGTGGVGVIDAKALTYPRHLGFNYGVPQALALDGKRGRLYVADVAEGLIHVVDSRALTHKDEKKARGAWLGSVPLPPPDGFPLFRPAEDFGIDAPADLKSEMSGPYVGGQASVGDGPLKRRAGVEIHTGPQALVLADDGKSLLVLERFTGRLTRLDVTGALPVVKERLPLFDPLVQRERRLGQIVYFADLGRTGMSCDSCHMEGHSEGVFFTKTGMMRIWRSTTNRGVRDVPPYFNPPAHPTLENTAAFVGSRNRFQNPRMSDDEIRYVSTFVRGYTTLPNPFRAEDGGLADEIDLGEGRRGVPAKGRVLFEARCAGCHPAPLFATDQDERTRTRFLKVGTPLALEIRVDEQDTSFVHRTPPSLVGAWDVWPMLLTASAGFHVSKDGPWLEAKDRQPIRAVLERYSPGPHGDAMSLSDGQRRDLEAFVMSL